MLPERGLESCAELLRRDTRRTRTRTNEAEGQDDIQDTEATYGAAKRRMEQHGNERGKVEQKEVLFPEAGPREIEEQGSHFKTNDDHQCAQNAVHE